MFSCSIQFAEQHRLFYRSVEAGTGDSIIWHHRILSHVERVPVLGDLVALIEYLVRSVCCFGTNGNPIDESSVNSTNSDSIDQGSITTGKPISSSQPQIIKDGWGFIHIEWGRDSHQFKDAVIYPGEANRWNWAWDQSDSMHHHPGVRAKDVNHFLSQMQPEAMPDVAIISRGRGHGGGLENPGPGILEIGSDVETVLREQGIKEVYMLKTAAAIEKYKELAAQGKTIFALIHTTC